MIALAIPAPFLLLASAAFLAAWLLQPQRRQTAALPWWKQLALPATLVLGGVGGSHLPVVLASGDWVPDNQTLTTALAVGYLLVEVTRLVCMLPPSARDGVALPLSLALVVVRLECFVKGCCRGVESSLWWAVDFGDGVRRHPTQLYECCFHLLCGAAIVWLRRGDRLRGQVLRLYLVAYCVYRFATEWIRLEPPSWLGLTYSQGVVALFGTVLVILWGLDVRGSRATGPSNDPKTGTGPLTRISHHGLHG